MSKKIKITFCSGAGEVTGSNFLLESDGLKVLIDCGLIQGTRKQEEDNHAAFPYDPADIDTVFITHSHLDHIGRLPKLVKEGFRGKIYSTAPTKEIAAIALQDGLGVMSRQMKTPDLPPIYNEEDIAKTISLWQTVGYHEPVKVGDFDVVLRDSGHILGSAMVEFTYGGKKLVFTGDLGNSPAPLLRDTEEVTDASFMVMESVYGDRNHEDRAVRRDRLEDVIEETMRRGGTLMIPSFSIERTQELLYEIENMMESSRIPLVPVFLDSPMSIKVTEIYKNHKNYFNKEALAIIKNGDGLFKFPQFHETMSTDESKAIIDANPKKIVIAGSGMSNGGRIIHHEKNYLPDPKSTLLLIGYQGAGTLGRQIEDGARSVRILGEEVPINARVAMISGYSAHKDGDGLFNFVHRSEDTLKKVFVVMGEPKSSLHLVQRIRDNLAIDATAPQAGESVEFEL